MNITEWLMVISFGAVLGLLGQGLRIVAGIKKRHDEAAQVGKPLEPFDMGKFYFSLFTGALAGALAAFTMREDLAGSVSDELVLALIATGYAGSDFIEGFVQKNISKLTGQVAPVAPPPVSPQLGPAVIQPGPNEADSAEDKAEVDRPETTKVVLG